MAAEGDNIIRYNYTGGDRRVPRDATHITVDESVPKIPALTFQCFESLRRVIMPGVEVVGGHSLIYCKALTEVECDKLEIIQDRAFSGCKALRSIDLPSAKIVEGAFNYCFGLTEAKFGSKLERIEGGLEDEAFARCRSLERITIPLKDGLIADDGIFQACDNLMHVDLVEGEVHETIAALQLEEWRNDMNEEIDSINQILPTVDAGDGDDDVGGKARAIRTWIRSVLGKIIHYKAEHKRLLNEQVATTLEHSFSLSQDIVMNNVLPFLELPSYTFELEEEDDRSRARGGGSRSWLFGRRR